MGQAKKRGTFEQRQEQALRRDYHLARNIMASDHPKLKRALRMSGIKQISQAMIKLGVIKPDDPNPQINWPSGTPKSPIVKPW